MFLLHVTLLSHAKTNQLFDPMRQLGQATDEAPSHHALRAWRRGKLGPGARTDLRGVR